MRAVMVMFDSLRLDLLPNYGADCAALPNFARLAERTVTFDRNFVGSLPWLSARGGLPGSAHGIVCSFYLNMAKSDHSEGGITFEAAKAQNFGVDTSQDDVRI